VQFIRTTKVELEVVGVEAKAHAFEVITCSPIILDPKGECMKRQALTVASLLSVLLVAGSALAQTNTIRANVPFSFTIGEKTVPAGTYMVGRLGHSPELVILRTGDGKPCTILTSNSVENRHGANKTKLVFNHYKDQYFLSEIWIEGATSGRRMLRSTRETELARELAAAEVSSGRVEIVAALY
jgi:hypothetical protein